LQNITAPFYGINHHPIGMQVVNEIRFISSVVIHSHIRAIYFLKA
jgi:hypothetical protein